MAIGTVILVPGLLGSELRASAFPFLTPTIWLNYARLIAGGWRLLALQGVIPLTAGPPLQAYYGPAIERLGQRGWRVVGAQLDWRRSLFADGSTLAALIRTYWALTGQPVHLVCHSRGGLVARAALQILDEAGHLAFVGRVVGLGVPHRGSLSAAQLLGGFQSSKLLLYALLSVGDAVLSGGYPNVELNAIIAGWPSVYELLPQPGWLAGWEQAVLYDSAYYAPQPYQQSLATTAEAAWETLPEAPSAVAWLDLYGTGVDTPMGLIAPVRLTSSAGYRYGLIGDGVVPVVSAAQEDHPAEAWQRVSHDQLPQDGRVLDRVHAWLMGGS